jgi:DNA-binding MarR family transcriptional regulator
MTTTDATTTGPTATSGAAGPSGDGEPRWLSEAEMTAWLPLVRLVTRLPHRLDRQLRQDAGISHVYHQILAMLSQAQDQQLRMSELAASTATSPSRLSHAVAALEDRGWVTRCPAATDRRGQLTRLTPAGRAAVEQITPRARRRGPPAGVRPAHARRGRPARPHRHQAPRRRVEVTGPAAPTGRGGRVRPSGPRDIPVARPADLSGPGG